MPSLEDELKALIGGAGATSDASLQAKKDAGRARRKSKELLDALDSMEAESKTLSGSVKLWQGLAPRNRRKSTGMLDLTTAALQAAFKEIDTDNSGTIEKSELLIAIRKVINAHGFGLHFCVCAHVGGACQWVDLRVRPLVLVWRRKIQKQRKRCVGSVSSRRTICT